MVEIELVEAILLLGIISITGGFAYAMKMVGPLAVWALASALMLIGVTFEYPFEIVLGLGVLTFLVELITLVIDVGGESTTP